jgi:hypothetical protein
MSFSRHHWKQEEQHIQPIRNKEKVKIDSDSSEIARNTFYRRAGSRNYKMVVTKLASFQRKQGLVKISDELLKIFKRLFQIKGVQYLLCPQLGLFNQTGTNQICWDSPFKTFLLLLACPRGHGSWVNEDISAFFAENIMIVCFINSYIICGILKYFLSHLVRFSNMKNGPWKIEKFFLEFYAIQ